MENKIKSIYNKPKRYLTPVADKSLTKQSFKDECDINNVLKRFEKTGQLPDLIKQNPVYGDFADAPAYQDAMNLIIHAQDQFDALSSRVRDKFNNDPTKFLEFCNNPNNIEEMYELGMAIRPPRPDDLAAAPAKEPEAVIPAPKG